MEEQVLPHRCVGNWIDSKEALDCFRGLANFVLLLLLFLTYVKGTFPQAWSLSWEDITSDMRRSMWLFLGHALHFPTSASSGSFRLRDRPSLSSTELQLKCLFLSGSFSWSPFNIFESVAQSASYNEGQLLAFPSGGGLLMQSVMTVPSGPWHGAMGKQALSKSW